MYHLHSKFDKDQTKTAVAIVEDSYFGQTHRQTDKQTDPQVILYLSSVMHCIGQTIIAEICSFYVHVLPAKDNPLPFQFM